MDGYVLIRMDMIDVGGYGTRWMDMVGYGWIWIDMIDMDGYGCICMDMHGYEVYGYI